MKISRYAYVPFVAATLISACTLPNSTANAAEVRSALAVTHIPKRVFADTFVGKTDTAQDITLDLVLHLRNEDKVDATIRRISDPRDPMYGHYLTPTQFRDQFGPTQSDVDKVETFAKSHGLSVTYVSPARTFVQVRGSVATANTAFGVTLHDFASITDGHIYHSPNTEPMVDATVAPLLTGVVGLSNSGVPHWFSRPILSDLSKQTSLLHYNGTGGLSPSDTTSIYGMSSLLKSGVTGSGQVLGLFEIGTFTATDITKWDTKYSIPKVTVTPVSVDGYNTNSSPGDAADEVTLDIDMLETWAYGASQIRVYENNDNISSDTAFIDEAIDNFSAMANDTTRPEVISVSYGISELDLATSDLQSEGEVIQQLALQGQTVCVASGDAAAYTDQSFGKNDPNTSDPGSQPYVTGVGGTDLTDSTGTSPTLISETSWFDSKDTGRGSIGTGGGGGISSYWTIPNYQVGSFSTTVNTQGSTTFRNVPDVSLYGDYDTGGYSIYFTGYGFVGVNGTSASSPLWASLLADVNQVRKSNGLPDIGFANPAIYLTAESSNYATDFYDVADGSTNGYYKAVTGYDDSTGWGTILNGTHLVADLAATSVSPIWTFASNGTSVTSGSTLTGTLSVPLPASQAETFTLTSSSSAATVPATATIAKGATSTSFTITAQSVTSATPANITATLYGIGQRVAITVNPSGSSTPTLSSVSVNPASVSGGSTSTGTVTFTGSFTVNKKITLSNNNTAAATVPASVVLPAGRTTATFKITTSAVTSAATVMISAKFGAVTKTTTLTVNPGLGAATLSSFTLSPATVTGGNSSTGTVTLSADAPTGGAVIALVNTNKADSTAPTSVTVSAGSISASFPITTVSVSGATSTIIKATYSGASISKKLTINP